MLKMSTCARVLTAVLVIGWTGSLRAQVARRTSPSHVGVLLDGPSAFNDSLRAGFVREIEAFFGTERVVDFPASATIAGDWTSAGAATALDRLLADSSVQLVLALGPIGSNELAHRRTLPKPAIAALVLDAALQGLPVDRGASGVRNLSYVNVAYSASRSIAVFHSVMPFRRLAVLLHPGVMDAIPGLRALATELAPRFQVQFVFVPVTASAADALRLVPADADAAYLAPLEQLPVAGLDSIISGLNTRRLPVFSYSVRGEVRMGALASYAPRDDMERRARRVAGSIQRILHGEDAGTFPVGLAAISQLTLNMATARLIGFSPDWTTLTDADVLNEDAPATGEEWTLARVGVEARRVNLDLLAAARDVESAHQDVRSSRAALLPQVQASGAATLVRANTAAASFGQQPERSAQGILGLSQTIYSESRWADYDVTRHTLDIRAEARQKTELDVVLRATTAYVDVLQRMAIARIERANLRLTRSNLEVAQLREQTGTGSRSDVYRWQAELAQSRSSVLAAEAQVELARLELNAVLDRPLEEPFRTVDVGADDPALITSEPELLAYFRDPVTFRVFRDFMVSEGRAAAPELRALDAAIAAQRRVGTAARRSYFLPNVSLLGSLSSVLWRDGAGSSPPSIGGIPLPGAPDATWSLRLQASLPLFEGFARDAQLDRANVEVERLTLERQSVDLSLTQQIRGALYVCGAAWATIAQSRAAFEAARGNLDLVSDAYARGAANIVTLLDAQQAAQDAAAGVANAVYGFLVQLLRAERAIGQFDILRTPEQRRALLERLAAFQRAAGAGVPFRH